MSNPDLLAEAKRRLPLPQLMAQLGHGDRAKKSARCPFHEDSSASFSVFPGNDGELRWKCFAGCGQGGAIDFLAVARNLSNADACREFIRLAGISVTAAPAQGSTPNFRPAFDWSAWVAALTEEHRAKLATWRGYTPEFVTWLHAQNLIGLFDGHSIGFPVHGPGGAVLGCHYRLKEDGTWRYHPKKVHPAPLVIGDVKTAGSVLVFESQWDALAVIDKLGWHAPNGMPDTAVIITRGASNGKFVAGLCSPDAPLYAFPQNDPPRSDGKPTPAEKWLQDVAAHSGCKTLRVVTPTQHKDANDWTKAGASADDLWQAIHAAKPFSATSENPVSTPSITEGEEDDEPTSTPFPTAALPSVLRDLVAAVANAKGVPEALPACCAIAATSAAIGAGLDVQSGHDQRTRANLFLIASAESGSGKSKVFKLLLAPLFRHEESVIDRWKKEDGPHVAAEKAVLETEIHDAKSDIRKCATDDDRKRIVGQIAYRQAKLDELSTKTLPRLLVQDATVEAVGTLLSQNRGILFSASADARKLADNLLGRYSQAKNSKGKISDDAIYLQAYSGDTIALDRQGRQYIVPNPCMCILWLVQPDIVERFLDEDSLQEGGFLARLLLCHTQAAPQKIGEGTVSVPDVVCRGWESLIADLLATYHRPGAAFTIQPTEAAKQCLIDHYNAIVDRLATDLHDVKPFAMRWTEQAWRLSVVFHSALWGKEAHNHQLALETVESAIAAVDWFAAQQLEILARGRHEAARKLEDRVFDLLTDKHERQGLDYITARDVHRARITRTATEARALLARMEQNSLLIGEDMRRPEGGHVVRIYRSKSGPNPVPG